MFVSLFQAKNSLAKPFDAIRHMDGEREFWRARELSKILGYNRWENFENVIAKARSPNFESIKQISPYGAELMSLIRDNRNVIEFANYPNAVRELNTYV